MLERPLATQGVTATTVRALARQGRSEIERARNTDAAESSGEAAHSPASNSAPQEGSPREESTFEHAEAKAELEEVEGDAGRERSVENKVEEARGAPMAGGGAVRVERRQESERESRRARTGWRREWRVHWRCPQAEGEVVASASVHAVHAAPLA